MANANGMNWLRQEKRLALYLRDGLACVYCGKSLETGANLTLDHIVPRTKGGTNHESNLVTACDICNKSKGERAIQPQALIRTQPFTSKPLYPFLQQAKQLIASRGGSAARVLASLKEA